MLQSVHFKSRTDFFPVFQLSMNPAQPFPQDEEDYMIMITLAFTPTELFEKWLGAMKQRSLKTSLICSSVQVKKILSMEHYFTLSFPCNRIAKQDLNWGFKPKDQHFDLLLALVTLKKKDMACQKFTKQWKNKSNTKVKTRPSTGWPVASR